MSACIKSENDNQIMEESNPKLFSSNRHHLQITYLPAQSQ